LLLRLWLPCRHPTLILSLLLGMSLGSSVENLGTPMSFKVNELTEEEQRSDVIPENFRCQACNAITYQIKSRISKVNPRVPASLDKPELRSQTIKLAEALEQACSADAYSEYGVKELMNNGGKVLDGPGIENDQAGVKQGGGKWGPRFRARCKEMLEEAGGEEEDLAALWRTDSLEGLCEHDCSGKKKETKPRKPRSTKVKRSEKVAEKKEKRIPTGLEELPAPPHECQVATSQMLEDFKNQKLHRFALVLFYDATPRSANIAAIFEYGARLLKKEKSKHLRKMIVARYDSAQGDTWGYDFKGKLPKALLFRKGYRNPKKYDGALNGPQDMVDWMKNEIKIWMKDDEKAYPRLEDENKAKEL